MERQQRVQAAQQNMRLYSFVAALLMIFSAWRESPSLLKEIKELPQKEKAYINMWSAKCKLEIENVVKLLHKKKKWPAAQSSFFFDTSDKMGIVLDELKERLTDEEYTALNHHKILTYVFSTALLDWWNLSERDEDYRKMVKLVMQFSNHIIQNDDPILLAMNDIFWSTREKLHSNAELPVYDFENFPKGTAEYERRRHGILS